MKTILAIFIIFIWAFVCLTSVSVFIIGLCLLPYGIYTLFANSMLLGLVYIVLALPITIVGLKFTVFSLVVTAAAMVH